VTIYIREYTEAMRRFKMNITLTVNEFAQNFTRVGSVIASDLGITLDSLIIRQFNEHMEATDLSDEAQVNSTCDLAGLMCVAAGVAPSQVEQRVMASYGPHASRARDLLSELKIMIAHRAKIKAGKQAMGL
jgi:hypothetical protein